MSRANRALACLALVGASVVASATASTAQDGWNPFQERDRQQRERGSRRIEPAPTTPDGPTGGGLAPAPIERRELAPLALPAPVAPPTLPLPPAGAPGAAPAATSFNSRRATPAAPTMAPPLVHRDIGSEALPSGLWQGLDAAAIEALVAPLKLPVRSPVLARLWRRVWSAPSPASADPAHLEALRLEILHRSGDIAALRTALAQPGRSDAPTVAALRVRAAIAIGDKDAACRGIGDTVRQRAKLPPSLRTDMLIAAGYCAAASGNPGAAGLTAELMRGEGVKAPLALSVLDAIASGTKPHPRIAGLATITPMEFRYLALAGAPDVGPLVEHAEPLLLTAWATASDLEPRARLSAAEAAARQGLIAPDTLAAAYRQIRLSREDLANPLAADPGDHARRALLFQAAEAERAAFKKTRLVRALLDDARRMGLYLPVASLLGPLVQSIRPVQEIGWFAETATEILIASGRLGEARDWIARAPSLDPGRGHLEHWLALADIADPAQAGGRGRSLPQLEPLAARGVLPPDVLHRLATVLDALDYQIPIPLWELASRTPQPTGGYLPPTGALSALQDASRRREVARTVLLVVQAIGPTAADGANIIALGDAIRALKRAGLEQDARRLGLESLIAQWPRTR